MFRFLFNRPISIIVAFFGLIVLSSLAILKMPVSALPDIDFPEILVRINFPDNNARSIDQNLIKELSTQLSQIPEIKTLKTESADGSATLRILFGFGANLDKAFIQVNEKLELAMPSFPKNIERPRVVKSSATDLPVFFITMSLRDGNSQNSDENKFLELSDFAVQVVKRRLEQLPEIAFADITGADKRILSIVPKTEWIKKKLLKSEDIRMILNRDLMGYGEVSVTEGGNNYQVEVKEGDLAEDVSIENRKVNYHGRSFLFGELFDIIIQPRAKTGLFLYKTKSALALAIVKQPAASLGDLRKATLKVIKDLSEAYPEIQFDIVKDQTFVLEYAVKALKQDLVAGCILAFLILLIFFASFRRALLIFITIPVSLLLSLLFFHLAGITVNIISLAGLIIGVGLMIDNSIIVIDSISSKLDTCEIDEACIIGVEVIVRPLFASALTTCSVFIPLVFLSGIAGVLFYDQAIAVCITLFTSLLVTTILLPILFKLTHSKITNIRGNANAEKRFRFFQYLYKVGFRSVFEHKKVAVLTAFALTVIGTVLFIYLPKERMPSLVDGEYEFRIKWRDDVSLDENSTRIRALLNNTSSNTEVSCSSIGTQQFLLNHEESLSKSEANVYIKAKSEKMALKTKKVILKYLNQNYPGTNVVILRPENIFEQVLGRDSYDLILNVSDALGRAPNPDQFDFVLQALNQKFKNLEIDQVPLSETITFQIDREKIARYNLNLESVYILIHNTLDVEEVGSYGSGESQIPIVYKVQSSSNFNNLISNTRVPISKKSSISLLDLVKISSSVDFEKINSEDNVSYVPININSSKAPEIKEFLVRNLRNPDLLLSFDEKETERKALVKEMLFVLLAAVSLLYLILAAQFNSFIQPLIVLAELPISVFGALLMLLIFGGTINLMSLIGLVVMSGIIINDSILKVDAINQLSKTSSLDLIEIIEIAGNRRLKSIVMTAMVTIISVLPFLFGSDIASNLQKPLSLTIIGGMLIGTPVSLYLLPLIYWYCYKKGDK